MVDVYLQQMFVSRKYGKQIRWVFFVTRLLFFALLLSTLRLLHHRLLHPVNPKVVLVMMMMVRLLFLAHSEISTRLLAVCGSIQCNCGASIGACSSRSPAYAGCVSVLFPFRYGCCVLALLFSLPLPWPCRQHTLPDPGLLAGPFCTRAFVCTEIFLTTPCA